MKIVSLLHSALIIGCILSAITGSASAQKELRFETLLNGGSIENIPTEYFDSVIKAKAAFAIGYYSEAELLYKRALSLLEKAGTQDKNFVFVLTEIANSLRPQDRYAEAEPLIMRALTIQEKRLGRDHLEVATSLENLAFVYAEQGQYAQAEPLFKRALVITENARGPDDAAVASSLIGLADLYRLQGLYTEAEPLFMRALTIQEKVLGPDHPDVAGTLEFIAKIYYSQARYEDGKRLIMRAVGILEKSFSNEPPDHALNSMNRLAYLLAQQSGDAEAEALQKKILATAEKAVGREHPIVATSLHNLASLYHDRGQDAQASPLLARAMDISYVQMMQVLIGGGERLRLMWQHRYSSFDLPAVLFKAQAMADYILHFKGVVLDSLIQDRILAAHSKTGQGTIQLYELLSLKEQLSKTEGNLDPSAQKTATEIKDKIDNLEGALGKTKFDVDKYGGRAALSVQEILPLVPADTVLIDFVAYNTYSQKKLPIASYGFSSLSPSGGVHWTKIEQGEEINQAVTKYRDAIISGDEKALSINLRLLYEKLWLPIEAVLPTGTKAVIISPDSLLNFLSFSCILDKTERFVGEKYFLCYVGSGRDLVPQEISNPLNSFITFADPVYDSKVSSAQSYTPRSTNLAEYAGVTLPRLPGTQAEARQIKGLADGMHWTTQFSYGPEATEKAVRSVKSPTILHLATHGFYLTEQNSKESQGSRGMHIAGTDAAADAHPVVSNPMRQSGIALAGAQTTLRAWAEGQAPDSSNDGILTAEEVSTMNINGTWLVTLSACSTGAGEARSGEGVFGLRRAFMMAGARNLLLTLWPVSDESTASFMADFYSAALKNGDAFRSLAETQRHWLVDLRLKKGLLTAVRDAGPFVLATNDFSVLPERYEEVLAKGQKGEASAQFTLGTMLNEGRCVKKDVVAAFVWYKKAAEQNHVKAQSALGALFLSGQGIRKSGEDAVKWFRKAAEQNDPRGQNGLGFCYLSGDGVKMDYVEALNWFRKASEQDYAKSQYWLGRMYSDGVGLQKNEVEGIRWLRRSAEQKWPGAQYSMGRRYIDGSGVPKNWNEARHWLWLAACQKNGDALYCLSAMSKGRSYEYSLLKVAQEYGSEDAGKALVDIEKKLTTEEKNEGEKLTKSFSENIIRINEWMQNSAARHGR